MSYGLGFFGAAGLVFLLLFFSKMSTNMSSSDAWMSLKSNAMTLWVFPLCGILFLYIGSLFGIMGSPETLSYYGLFVACLAFSLALTSYQVTLLNH